MQISLVGVNHEAAPVVIREKVAISIGQLPSILSRLGHHLPCGVILSTCNRTEVYTIHNDSHWAEKASFNFLRTRADVSEDVFLRHVYFSTGEVAAEHLFRVASGLDSMVIGEFEILGQVAQALEAAEKAKVVNLPLRHLFQSAIRTGRRVREETEISKNAISVSSVALDLAAKVVGDLRDKKMMVIGTGEAGRLVAKAARDRGVSPIVVASRTQERASVLAAKLGGRPIDLDNLVYELTSCNIVVTCAGAPRKILDLHHVNPSMKTRPESPLVIIDIAVPRNVAPTVSKIRNVFLYNIDDLNQISCLNREQRGEETHEVERIISSEVIKFDSRWQSFEARPIVSSLMEKAEDIRCKQLKKTLDKLRPLSDKERDDLDAMTKSIVNKILKEPIDYLKEHAEGNRDYGEMVSELFQLDREGQE